MKIMDTEVQGEIAKTQRPQLKLSEMCQTGEDKWSIQKQSDLWNQARQKAPQRFRAAKIAKGRLTSANTSSCVQGL